MSALVAIVALAVSASPALDLGLPRAAREPRGGCPASARVEVSLPAWAAALQQAATPDRRDALLGELKLELPETSDERGIALAAVTDQAVQLEPEARADHVVEVRFHDAGGDDVHLVQVLRPIDGRAGGAGHAYCAIGDALLAADARAATYTISFVPLLDAKAKAIQVERARAEPRETETRRELWVARGLALRKVFDEATGHMRSDAGVATTTVGTLVLAGGFPRRIELTRVTKRGGCEVRAGDAPCDDGGAAPPSTATWIYDGARYVPAKEPLKK